MGDQVHIPGLSWRELTAIAAAVPDGAEGLTHPAERLLMLLPMLGDIDMPHDAAAVVAQALTDCGIPLRSTRRTSRARS
ncbi:hypothetical protein AB0D12_09605 [Streptomyces sp. NPDC048479]|uniref:hypothetical protein n=1 Tax=Streptomyces sp. NPDC048479 TaxID=3154725 RepID=UPI00341BCEA0